MRIFLGNNPIEQLDCWICNKKENLIDWFWIHSNKTLTCHICGMKLFPKIEKFGPMGCGWKKIKGVSWNPYVCHHCLEHSMFQTGEEFERWQDMVKESNLKLKRKVKEYCNDRKIGS